MPKNETMFLIGESRTSLDNAITKQYGSFYLALEVESESGKIVEFSCTHTLDLTETFLRKLLVGKRLDTDYAMLEAELGRRYFGSSSKAVLVSLRDAEKRFRAAKERDKA
ncbi:MAG: DUF3870 domain-containing protein [Pygmaiobacter sp.]